MISARPSKTARSTASSRSDPSRAATHRAASSLRFPSAVPAREAPAALPWRLEARLRLCAASASPQAQAAQRLEPRLHRRRRQLGEGGLPYLLHRSSRFRREGRTLRSLCRSDEAAIGQGFLLPSGIAALPTPVRRRLRVSPGAAGRCRGRNEVGNAATLLETGKRQTGAWKSVTRRGLRIALPRACEARHRLGTIGDSHRPSRRHRDWWRSSRCGRGLGGLAPSGRSRSLSDARRRPSPGAAPDRRGRRTRPAG